MGPLRLTFGIELEFLCIYPRGLFKGRSGHFEDTACRLIYHRLKNNGVAATGFEEDDDNDYMNLPNMRQTPYSKWRVANEVLLVEDDMSNQLPSGWTHEGVELASPIFQFADEAEWRSEIRNVLATLKEIENAGCRIVPVADAGFHVHFGNGKRKFPLRTVKNVCQVMTALERAFDEIHAVHRTKDPESAHDMSWCAPLSFFHKNNGHNSEGTTMYAWIASIEETRTHTQLGRLFYLPEDIATGFLGATGHNCSVNFDNTFADADFHRPEQTLTNTIEFRQHASTRDFRDLDAWIVLVGHLVDYCHIKHTNELMWLCVKAASSDFRMTDAMTLLDCPPNLVQHYSQTIEEGRKKNRYKATVNSRKLPSGVVSLLREVESGRSRCNELKAISDQIVEKYCADGYGREPPNEIIFDLTREEMKNMLAQCRQQALTTQPFLDGEALDSEARQMFLRIIDSAW